MTYLARLVVGGGRCGHPPLDPDRSEKPRVDLNKPWRSIAKRAGLAGLRIHNLRHTHASFGAGAGLGPPIHSGKLLGYVRARRSIARTWTQTRCGVRPSISAAGLPRRWARSPARWGAVVRW
jgi:hypothetical protein